MSKAWQSPAPLAAILCPSVIEGARGQTFIEKNPGCFERFRTPAGSRSTEENGGHVTASLFGKSIAQLLCRLCEGTAYALDFLPKLYSFRSAFHAKREQHKCRSHKRNHNRQIQLREQHLLLIFIQTRTYQLFRPGNFS